MTDEVEEKENKSKGVEMMKEDERKEKDKGDEEERQEGKVRMKRRGRWTGIKEGGLLDRGSKISKAYFLKLPGTVIFLPTITLIRREKTSNIGPVIS